MSADQPAHETDLSFLLPTVEEQKAVSEFLEWRAKAQHLGLVSARELMEFLAHVVSVRNDLAHGLEPSSDDRIKTANRLLRAKAEVIRIAKADRRATNIRSLIDKLTNGEQWSLERIATALNDHGVPAPRGGPWSRAQVRRVLLRTEADSSLKSESST